MNPTNDTDQIFQVTRHIAKKIAKDSSTPQNNFTESIRTIGQTYLGNKNEIAIGLTDATTAIVANETESRDTGGANLAVQTRSVRNPFQRLSANSTTVIHGFFA